MGLKDKIKCLIKWIQDVLNKPHKEILYENRIDSNYFGFVF